MTTTELSVEAGDRYLLCSDGLSGQVPDAAIERILGEIADPGAAADELVRRANLAGGVDNVTVVVVDVAPRPAGRPPPGHAAGPGIATGRAADRAPGVAAAILLVLAVALLAGAIVAAVVSPPPATPAPPATPLPSVSPAHSRRRAEVRPGRANGRRTVIRGTAHCRRGPLTVGVDDAPWISFPLHRRDRRDVCRP